MASNEFRACKKALKNARTKSDIAAAVDILDAAWTDAGMSEKIMKDKDWARLAWLIHKTSRKLS
jgi:hypothetical protein